MGTGATSPAPGLGCAGALTALGGPLCASVVTAGKRAAQVSQRDGDSRAPKWTAKPARARPNGAPLPGPQDDRGRRGRPGRGVIEEREPRRDRRSPAADATHLEVSRLAIHLILRALCCFAPSPSALRA